MLRFAYTRKPAYLRSLAGLDEPITVIAKLTALTTGQVIEILEAPLLEGSFSEEEEKEGRNDHVF